VGSWASIKDFFGVGSDGGIKLEKILYIVTLLNQLWRKPNGIYLFATPFLALGGAGEVIDWHS